MESVTVFDWDKQPHSILAQVQQHIIYGQRACIVACHAFLCDPWSLCSASSEHIINETLTLLPMFFESLVMLIHVSLH